MIFFFHVYKWTGSVWFVAGVIAEKLLNVFHFTECIRIYLSILCSISVTQQLLPCLCAVMEKKNVLTVCVILGIKTECPIYREYNIARYLQRDAFLLPETFTFLYVCQGNKHITRTQVSFCFFSHNIISCQSSRSPLDSTWDWKAWQPIEPKRDQHGP